MTCRRLRICRRMPEERGMSQLWGGDQGAEPEADAFRGSPQIFSSALLCHSAASALPALSYLQLSLSNHPARLRAWKLTLVKECKATVPLSFRSLWRVQMEMEKGWLLPLPQPHVCVSVQRSPPGRHPSALPPPNVDFPRAESVSLPTQHLTHWS